MTSSWSMSGVPRTTQMTSRVMARTGLNLESHFTERNTRNGRHAHGAEGDNQTQRNCADERDENSLSVCTKPTFNA